MSQGQQYTMAHEGVRYQSYDDKTGATVGKGGTAAGTLTIGVGHTGKDFVAGDVWNKDQVMRTFDADYDIAAQEAWTLRAHLFDRLGEPRQAVLVDLVFQMGIDGVLKFKRFLDAMATGNWNLAGDELHWVDITRTTPTPYYLETPARAAKNILMLVTGAWQ